ncbi:MAG TPA: serine hydrolase domain-containing protein [Streptosporangiaceae bacterium]|jgi:CubicO group peptidase (beta-lactamase class C family)|nr:serine hydrolase domain-containing protein [Streptosporangiaceae bacterium]
MGRSGLSAARLERMHEMLARHVDSGEVPGLVAAVSRRGEAHVLVLGRTETDGGGEPMRRDAIFRIASVTKQIAAASAMTLLEEGRLRLDDPVDGLLPELADRRVLTRPDGPLDDTVPAHRPITLRDVLTFRMGLGAVMTHGKPPIQQAMAEAGLSPGPLAAPIPPDEWMKRLGGLPLVYQPGEKWMYHTGADVLGVLMARATGRPLEEVLAARLFGPLGMTDTSFHVPAGKLGRLPAAYGPDRDTGELVLFDHPRESAWAQPPAFPSAGGGLVSTADDLLAFGTMMLNKGRPAAERGAGPQRILSRPAVELMTTDHLTAAQKEENEMFFAGQGGWGFGVNVITRRTNLGPGPGSFGWTGGTGTTVYTDPAEEMILILLTQRLMTSPVPPAVFSDFFAGAYQAIDD